LKGVTDVEKPTPNATTTSHKTSQPAKENVEGEDEIKREEVMKANSELSFVDGVQY
jgi:hypothetical protein